MKWKIKEVELAKSWLRPMSAVTVLLKGTGCIGVGFAELHQADVDKVDDEIGFQLAFRRAKIDALVNRIKELEKEAKICLHIKNSFGYQNAAAQWRLHKMLRGVRLRIIYYKRKRNEEKEALKTYLGSLKEKSGAVEKKS